MEFLIGELVYSAIGFVYLWVRYRNKEKVIEIKDRHYGGSYAAVGGTKLLEFFLIILIGLIVIALFAGIYWMIRPIY